MGSSSDAVPDLSGNRRSPAGDASPVKDTEIPAEETASLRRTRPSRACTVRAQQRLQEQQAAERKFRPPKKENRREHRRKEEVEEEEDDDQEEEDDDDGEGDDDGDVQRQCGGGGSSAKSKIITSLVQPPEPSQMPRWNLRSMWELASVLNFLHVFRPLLKINAEFSAEEFETALLNPNDTLSDIHIPLLKAIPPVTRMALTRDTWVTVLCRKIRDSWHWVAEGDLPIVASQGRETEVYKSLDPAIRVVILKALCDIRVELADAMLMRPDRYNTWLCEFPQQEDIRSYIDNSLKNGVHLSTFRKDRVGGDSHGVNFWYEDDSSIGHRLYREIRKAEVIKVKTKGSKILPNVTYQWETVATNFDEFQDVAEKLNSSSSRIEVSLGKKLTRDMLPEIEKEHKRKEKLLKKQHRQALLLDNYLVVDGVGGGRSRRDRKPVRYTFDDYDRSINEAIKITTKKHPSPEPFLHRRESARGDSLVNGRSTTSSSHPTDPVNDIASGSSSDFADGDEFDEQRDESLDRSNRRRQRPQRYSATDFVETVSDNRVESGSDDDIVGEAVYDEEYLRKRKQKKFSSGSEGEGEEEKGDEEYKWDEDNAEYEEEEEEEEEDSPSASEEDSDEPRRVRKMPRRGTKLRSKSNGFRPGLRRSRRATRIDYQQYELSESDNEASGAAKRQRLVEPDPVEDSDESGNGDFTMGSEDSEENGNDPETNSAEEVEEEEEEEPREVNDNSGTANGTENNQLNKSNGTDQEEVEGVLGKRHYLDLNELAPVSGFDDGPSTVMKDDDKTDNS